MWRRIGWLGRALAELCHGSGRTEGQWVPDWGAWVTSALPGLALPAQHKLRSHQLWITLPWGRGLL
ncbi:MAG: hypothetical protein JWR57_770 [Mycetocola sp.]|nr:hypothetical protein [Mycetocola sp.]